MMQTPHVPEFKDVSHLRPAPQVPPQVVSQMHCPHEDEASLLLHFEPAGHWVLLQAVSHTQRPLLASQRS